MCDCAPRRVCPHGAELRCEQAPDGSLTGRDVGWLHERLQEADPNGTRDVQTAGRRRLRPLCSASGLCHPRLTQGCCTDVPRMQIVRTPPGRPRSARRVESQVNRPRHVRHLRLTHRLVGSECRTTTIRRFTHDAVQTNVRRPSDVGRVLSLVHIDGAQRPPLHTWTSNRRKTPGTSPFSVLLPQTAGNTDYVKWWVEPGKGQVTPLPRASTPRPDDVLGAPACSRRSGRGPAMHSAPSADRTRLPDDRRARRAVRPSRRAVRTGSRGDR